jgi:hypothetical protein
VQTDPDPTSPTRVLIVLAVLVAAVVVGLIVTRLPHGGAGAAKKSGKKQGAEPPPIVPPGKDGVSDEARQAVAEAVDAALVRLAAPVPPRDAVVAAWLEVETAAARVGVPRRPAQTPTEFMADLLSATAVPKDDVARLRGLYLAARFSEHPVTVNDVIAAREALTRIAYALGRPPVGVTG